MKKKSPEIYISGQNIDIYATADTASSLMTENFLSYFFMICLTSLIQTVLSVRDSHPIGLLYRKMQVRGLTIKYPGSPPVKN
jgi:hypothetical protein